MVEDLSDLLPICPPSVDLREQQQQPPEVPERPAGGGAVGSGPPGGRVPAEAACGGDLVARGGSARGESKMSCVHLVAGIKKTENARVVSIS